MSAVSTPRYTFEEYLARERVAEYKHEFYQGQVFAMSGGSLRHSSIGGNVFASLRLRLQGSGCRPRNSDQRIRVPSAGLATYPDVSVVCGEFKVDDEDPDAIVNPCVIFEVLSRSTESYDRGRKFDFYRQLASLREYILISQEEAHVEQFVRQDNGSWVLTIFKGVETVLALQCLPTELPLSEIYEEVEFGPEEEPGPLRIH